MNDRYPSALHHWIDRVDALRAMRRYGALNVVASLGFVLGILIVLAGLPVPAQLSSLSGLLDWSMLLLLVLVVYHFVMSVPLALALLPIVIALAAVPWWLRQLPISLPLVGTALLAMGICLDLACQRERSWRALVEFMQLAMLAPLWQFHHAVQRRD